MLGEEGRWDGGIGGGHLHAQGSCHTGRGGLRWGQPLCAATSSTRGQEPGSEVPSRLVWMAYSSVIFILTVFHLLLELPLLAMRHVGPHWPQPPEDEGGPARNPLKGTVKGRACSRPGISVHAETGVLAEQPQRPLRPSDAGSPPSLVTCQEVDAEA